MNNKFKPFQHIRYEYEQRHIYFLPPKIMARLEPAKPAYVLGTRGTGKTTLLKSLEWSERLNNSSLRRQLGADPFAARFVGCYLKLPLYMLAKLESQLPKLYPQAADILLSLYIDLITLQPICMGLADLAARGVLEFTPEQETMCGERLRSRYTFVSSHDGLAIPTLRYMKDALNKAQRQIEGAVLYDQKIEKGVLDAVTNIGELGRQFSADFGDLCNGSNPQKPWHFKACLDEAESLGELGRRVLNTMVRMSKAPLIFVAAFVGTPDALVETVNHSLMLADDDRSLVRLGDLSNHDFRILAEGVATARLQEATDGTDHVVNLDSILGKLDLNGLANSIIRESVDPCAKKLLESAKKSKNSDVLSLFTESELQTTKTEADETTWQRRRRDSAGRRKLIVAAYLALCRRLAVSPRYSSSEMIFEMSDQCIRDFLRFLNEIYIESNSTIESFSASKINPKIQDIAIKRASKAKLDCLAESGVHEPKPTYNIVCGLARLTATLQCSGKNHSNFRSPERGVFVIEVGRLEAKDSAWISSLVSEAVEAGFLILKSRNSQEWTFRVHTSLAAFYGFSYRGAYYDVRLSGQDVLRLANAGDSTELSKVADKLSVKHLRSDGDDAPLFRSKNEI